MNYKILFVFMLLISSFLSCEKSDDKTSYEIGDLYDKDGVSGIVYKVDQDGMHGMIVSLKEGAYKSWAMRDAERRVTEAVSLGDGRLNMSIIKSYYDIDHYPGFKWCEEMNHSGITGWYLPAKEELEELLNFHDKIQSSFIKNGGISLSYNIYMSSSEIDNSTYWGVNFQHEERRGVSVEKGKYSAVRAIRSF